MIPLRNDFIRRSLWSSIAVLLSLILAIGGLVKLHFLQQEGEALLAMQQAAQRLHAEVQTLNALAGQLPLTVSQAEAMTLTERIDSQWQAVAAVLLVVGQAEGKTDTIAKVKIQLDRIQQLLLSTTSVTIENRRMKASIDRTLAIERNQVRHLNAEAVQLATHANGLNADLEEVIARQGTFIRRMTYVLGGLILLSGLLGLFAVRGQFKLLDRRVIRRIESLSQTMANNSIAEHLKKTTAVFNDEIDLMHDELGKLLGRLDEQKNTLERFATTDALTCLKNRRMVMSALDMEVARARRHDAAPAVIMVDIDHFKRINDTYGHGGGDVVLKRIGALIAESVRETDIAGRYGGEEFLIVLPASNMKGATTLAEKLRQRIADESFDLGAPQKQHFSISLGVAFYFDESAEELLARADAALYQAKDNGRNRVEYSPSRDCSSPASSGAGINAK